MKRLDALLRDGVERRVFSQARAVVMCRGDVVFDGGPSPESCVFDLASVSKVMSTTALFHVLAGVRKVSLTTKLGEVLPGVAAPALTPADLLTHRSGLVAYRPWFADVVNRWPQLLEAEVPASLRAEVRAAVVETIKSEVPVQPPGTSAVYSDTGFILLGEALAAVGGAPQDALFRDLVATPLHLTARYRRISDGAPLPPVLADTGATRPREPAPGQEGTWSAPMKPALRGEVDDDTCWAMDGVSGHAGVFSTAMDVARFGQAVLQGWLGPVEHWQVDAATPGSTRTWGFDTPGSEAPSCGARFGPRAIGHLGFTGNSLWIDLDRQVVVALLTNRVVFGRANLQLKDFRPRFHDAVLDALGL